MKRIAVCLSGQPRTWEYCIDNIKSFLNDDEYEIDYFIHTWDINSYRPIERYDYSERHYYNHECYPQKYIDSYNPKLYKIQSFESFQNKLKKIKNPIPTHHNDNGNMINQMYSFKQSIVLKRIWERKNGFKYDYVIKLRPDLFFLYPSLRKNIELLQQNNKTFYAYHQYEKKWLDKLDNDWPPDMYWIFLSSEESDVFSSYFGKRIKFMRKNKNEYHLYKFTYDIGFDPYYNDDIEYKKIRFLHIIRPIMIPFIYNIMVKLNNKNITKNEYDVLEEIFVRTYHTIHGLSQYSWNNRKDWDSRKMIVDILKENNKLEDLKKYDIINFIESNPILKETIQNEINKYL